MCLFNLKFYLMSKFEHFAYLHNASRSISMRQITYLISTRFPLSFLVIMFLVIECDYVSSKLSSYSLMVPFSAAELIIVTVS